MDTLNSLVRIPLVAVGTTRTSLGDGYGVSGTGAHLDVLVLGEAPRQAAGLVADGQGFAGALESATARFRMEVDALRTTAWGVNLRNSSLAVGQVCLVEVEGNLHATVVVDITAIANSSDAEVNLSPAIPELDRFELDIEVFSRVIGVSQIKDPEVVSLNILTADAQGQSSILLGGVPSDLGAGKTAIVDGEGVLLARTVNGAKIEYPKANASVPVPQSLITLDGPLPGTWENLDLNIWYAPVPAGTLKKLPKLTWDLADLQSPLPVELTDQNPLPLAPDTPIVLIDAKGKLVTCHGTLTTLEGTTTFAVTEFLAGSGPLVPPAIRSTPDSSAMPVWHWLSTHDSPSMHSPMGQLGGSLGAAAAVSAVSYEVRFRTRVLGGTIGFVVETIHENVIRDVGASRASVLHTGRPDLGTHFIARGGILPVDTFAQPRRATPLDAPTKAPVDNARMPTLPAIEVIRERVDTATIALDLRCRARPIARRIDLAALAHRADGLRRARGVRRLGRHRLALRGPRLLGDARLALVVHTRQALDA